MPTLVAERIVQNLEGRLLILAPTSLDMEISRNIFSRASIPADFFSSLAEICEEMERGVGAIVLTEDTLASADTLPLFKILKNQPAWSEIPVILLVQGGADSLVASRAFDTFGNVFLLDRPVRLNTLISAAKTALRGRQRQYQLRSELSERIQAEKALRISEHALRIASEELEIKVRERTRDLTAKTRELARSNADLEHFAYVASHDLREPLRMVSSYTQLLVRRLQNQLDDETLKFSTFVTDGIKRMNVLIEDLLSYSRLGRGELQLEPTDLNTIVQRVASDYEERIKNGELAIETRDLPQVMVSRTQILQVFQNLISNAVKFRGNHAAKILITGTKTDGQWVISVKDNGIGIEQEYFDRIFIIFQRLHTQSEYPGTGIGLAICKRIIERHGGQISLESQPGKGTTFLFTLPAEVA